MAKCEYLNPSGSIKDRIAQHIINQAEASGDLKPGMTVVAATSGNTGAAIAMACALRGYDYIVITNEKTSKEKVDAMKRPTLISGGMTTSVARQKQQVWNG